MGQTVLIFGGRSDIGQALAYEFARHKFDVILAARNADNLSATRSDLNIRFGVEVGLLEFDAADFGSHAKVYESLSSAPDVVIYSIGYLGEQPNAQNDWNEAERIINVNYAGGVSILSIAANEMERRGSGTIIGISSVAGERGRKSNYIYGSAKAGFTTFLSGLRHRLAGSGVNVLTVKPGFVNTKMTAGLDLPAALTVEPGKLASAIYSAYRRGRPSLYYHPAWKWIMAVIRVIPERIFVKTKL